MDKTNILVIDDEKDICRALNIILSKEGYAVTEAYNGEQAVDLLKKQTFDIIMTDIKMDKMDGFEVLRQAQSLTPGSSVVMMTAFASVGSAVEAMRAGAADYITKPFINDDIRLTIKRIVESRELQMENQILRQELSQRCISFKNIIGTSDAIQKVFSVMEKVIPSKANILITGESGTGKGLVAQAIHESGPRMDKPFISINCGAIPENLLESELFGHKKGSFTSAIEDKKGLITMANSGTLFLDEVGELPSSLQVKLLNVIQNKELTPVGDTRVIAVDVRIIAATNADLMQRVKDGRFREDLFYRLNVIEIRIPSLRERKDDIPLLIKHYLQVFNDEAGKKIKDIDYEAMKAMLAYDWPGNIRELRNTLERAVVLAEGDIVTLHDLPDKFRSLDLEGIATSSLRQALDDYEREYIRRSLAENKGNKEATATRLGIDLATLYRKLKKLRIDAA
ncbi:MAG: sigma-54-dependent Fis family transcriptional regulator [Nitrospirae bacterium]|nr:sigma-54-dependent Fis family transcriptional regulator [Nitrospirota bacterium]